jgi:hypothetical protein
MSHVIEVCYPVKPNSTVTSFTSKLSTIFRGRSVFRPRLSGFLRPAKRKVAVYEAAVAQRETRYQAIEENLHRENKALRFLLSSIGKSQVISESLRAERDTKKCPQNGRA